MKQRRPYQLTPKQLEAVYFKNGPLLVIAGAGTGKTAVITQRIAKLVLLDSVPAESILALTFTEKAASEMQQRVDELLPMGYVDTQIMTFHALAERILREYGLDIGLHPEFNIASNAQQLVIMQQIIASFKFSYFSPPAYPFSFVEALLKTISTLKDRSVTALKFNELLGIKKSQLAAEELARLKDLSGCYLAFQQRLEDLKLLDFGDLLIYLTEILKKPALQKEISNRFNYIMVDEFQDTNPIQLEILKLLLTRNKNLMVVGDDDQAIYKFRGASVENILNFKKKFPKAKTIVIKENFRSNQDILDAAYSLIQNNNPDRLEVIEKIDKKLVAQNTTKPEINVFEFVDFHEESLAIIKKIRQLIKNKVKPNHIAILVRKNNQIKNFALVLKKEGVNIYVNQSAELFEQPIVKTMVVATRSICDNRDSAALYQLLSSDLFNIPTIDLIGYSAEARRAHVNLEDYLSDVNDEKIRKSLATIKSWRTLTKKLTAGEVLYSILKQSGFLKKKIKQSENDTEAAMQIQFLANFFKLIKEFEISSNNQGLVDFNLYLDELAELSKEIQSDVSPIDIAGVQIMTVHRAKGLEFEYVFLPSLVEQTFPTYQQNDRIKIPEEILKSYSKGNHYEEERRLFYVALTRAKRGLWLSYSLDCGGKKLKRPSRFINESGLSIVNYAKSLQKFVKQQSFDGILNHFEPTRTKNLSSDLLVNIQINGWLYLSTNQIADYLRSPKEFWLFHILRMPKGPFHALVYGSAIHSALEFFYKKLLKNQTVSIRELLEVYQLAWKSEGFVSAEHERTRFEAGKAVLTKFYKNHKTSNRTVLGVEQPFELHLKQLKAVITGRYDLVLGDNEGVEIRDFKTSDVKDEKIATRKAKQSVQLGIYALAWQKLQHKPIKSVSLEFINNQIIGKNTVIDHDKTMILLKSAIEGIRNQEFSEAGESRLNFNRFLV